MKYFLLLMLAFGAEAGVRTEKGGVMPVTFSDYPLVSLVKDYAELMNINITWPASLFRKEDKIHLVLSSPVSKDDFRQIVYNLLASRGFTPIEEYGVLWIYNSRDIRYVPSPITRDMNFPTDARYRTAVYQLKYPISNIVALNLRPYMSRYGRVIDFSDARTVIINDTAENIKRVIKVIEFMDNQNTFNNWVNDVPKKDPDEMDPLKEKIFELELEKKILEKKYTDLKNDQGVHP